MFFTIDEIIQRRHKLTDLLSPNETLLVYSGDTQFRNNDTEYEFRIDSNFYYLTGILDTKDSFLIMHKSNHGILNTILVLREVSPVQKKWSGGGISDHDASKYSGIEKIIRAENTFKHAQHLLSELKVDQSLITSNYPNFSKERFKQVLGKLRLIKSKDEIALMQLAGGVSAFAHEYTANLVIGSKNRNLTEQIIKSEFYLAGSKVLPKLLPKIYPNLHHESLALSFSYPPIIAADANSCILHYNACKDKLTERSWCLMDAAFEIGCYASDITRTICVDPDNGYFNEVHSIVQAAQHKAIESINDKSALTLPEVHKVALRVLCEGLSHLKILNASAESIIHAESYKEFFMHKVSHWIGIDVHDPCPYKSENNEDLPLQDGMVFSVEPGLYFTNLTNPYYRGMGVRIEDCVAIKDGKAVVLTKNLI